MTHKQIKLKQSSDIVAARQACREMARGLGFGSADQTRLATAVSELTRNAIQYAGEGVCVVTDESENETAVIRVVVEDHGPGIADVDKALELGFTTSGGLGAGLSGVRRLAHDFVLNSEPGHTIVQLKMLGKKR
ncbi:MAG: anti-sigma regulatory factor [Nitrospiraceae bacterium]|nr:anti-sigma regulatory factor [Nitrospiraceae bacterium]